MGACFVSEEGRMSTSRALLIAFFASVTLVSCRLSEDYMVSEELVQEPSDDTLAMNGGTTVNKDESNAHAGITDMHAKTALCAKGQVPCGNGICAENCALLETSGINGEKQHDGYDMEFSPDIHSIKGPPKVAGKGGDYQQLEDNHRRAYQVDQTKAIQKAEAAAGLGFGSHQLALDEKASRFQGKEEDVNIKMNEAAKMLQTTGIKLSFTTKLLLRSRSPGPRNTNNSNVSMLPKQH